MDTKEEMKFCLVSLVFFVVAEASNAVPFRRGKP
jgi:hypothetical protein